MSGSPTDRDHLWRALSLDERLALLSGARPRDGDDDAVLHRWRAMYTDAGAFGRRLSWTDTSLEAARAAVAFQPPPDVARADLRDAATNGAAWVTTLEDLIGALRQPLATPPEAAWLDIPFVHLWCGLLSYARQRLRDRLSIDTRALITPPIAAGLDRLLLQRLSQVSTPVLYDGFTRRRPPGSRLDSLVGTPSSAHYTRYVDLIRSDGGTTLFAAYPVLARLAAHTVDCWTDGSAILLVRLAADREALSARFPHNGPLGEVVSFETPLSDPHAGHQVVCRLGFASGLALAYKPRSIAMESALGRVATWLAARGVEAGRVPPVLERDGYGWIEWTDARPCPTASLERYYRRMGGLIALLHLLRGTDAHVDNLVTHGDWPVLVDAETLGQSEGVQAEPALTETPSLTLDPTVLRTGILPGWHDGGGGPGGDVSALGAVASLVRARMHEWDAVNTDGMAPARAAQVTREPNAPARPHQYLAAIDEGFTAAYHALVDGRRELLGPGGILEGLERHRSRFVFRPTHIYDQLRRASLSPAAMANGVTRSLCFERLRVPFARLAIKPPHWDVVTGEITQLYGHDVPCFAAAGHAPVIDIGVAHPVPVVRRTPVHEMRAGFDAAGEEDLALQRMLLQGSILAHAARVDASVPAVRETASTSSSPDALIAAATSIAAQVAERARHDARLGTYWLGPRFTPSTGRFAFHASGESLFEGAMGTALFLHACDWCTGEPRFGAIADDALHGIRRYLDVAGDASSEWFARRLGIGGAFGLGSFVYGFVVLAAITRRPADLEYASAAARLITSSAIDRDRQLDVTGGAAGAILSLLTLHTAAGHEWCLEIARRCGHHLISRAQEQPTGGLGWITTAASPIGGFAHGSAGIALALSRLAAATGEAAFADAARAGLEADDRWLEVQTAPRPGQWCRGAAGDGLARIGISDTHAQQLLTPGDHAPAGDLDTLCCGWAGCVDGWLVADQVYDSPSARAAARRGAADLAARARQHALRCVPPLDGALLHPGLFQGAAGIGWTLLRAHGAALPSLLWWESPASARWTNRDTMPPEAIS